MGLFWSAVFVIVFTSLVASSETTNTSVKVKTYIVSVENALKPSEFSEVKQWYNSILESLDSNSSTLISDHNTKRIRHVYKTVFNGFSTMLTPHQAQLLQQRPEILRLFPERLYQLQTTHTPQFLGLPLSDNNHINLSEEYGSDVIIGMIDTGIMPERRSFNDQGMDPIPPQWKGECQGGEDFTQSLCNKKIIGARYFTAKFATARDYDGHGTHTASIAAGRAVENASFFGYAEGTAAGVAPKARLAIYAVCAGDFCSDPDILAGMDKAVDDGVNILSISLGAPAVPEPLISDSIAIAAFAAMEKGIIVSASAGNEGKSFPVSNIAPWIITVGASTIDRKFPADLLLEHGLVISGVSLYNDNGFPSKQFWPLIYAGNASLDESGSYCIRDSLNQTLVHGKIVVCDVSLKEEVETGLAVKAAGGVGVVVANVAPHDRVLSPAAHLIPGLHINGTARLQVLDYISSSLNPRATMVFQGTQVGIKPAPVVAGFSSRGPYSKSIYVMKPDVIAPGVKILAAWSNKTSPTESKEDLRRTEFNIISGTSMSCPHVSGIAALLRGAHKDWSPAMIKSAIMTTAYTNDLDGNPITCEPYGERCTAWDMGSGHVDPPKALDPGLMYDLTSDDYVDFLCASNMSVADIKVITRRSVIPCDKSGNPWDLNYPAISVAFRFEMEKEIVVKRTVTHLGDQKSSYNAIVNSPKGVITTVDPQWMDFKSKGEKLSYVVQFAKKQHEVHKRGTSEFGQLTWTDGKHNVTSPLIVTY